MPTLTSAVVAGALAAVIPPAVVAEPALPTGPAVVAAPPVVADPPVVAGDPLSSLPHAASRRAPSRAPSPVAPVASNRRRFQGRAGIGSVMGFLRGGRGRRVGRWRVAVGGVVSGSDGGPNARCAG